MPFSHRFLIRWLALGTLWIGLTTGFTIWLASVWTSVITAPIRLTVIDWVHQVALGVPLAAAVIAACLTEYRRLRYLGLAASVGILSVLWPLADYLNASSIPLPLATSLATTLFVSAISLITNAIVRGVMDVFQFRIEGRHRKPIAHTPLGIRHLLIATTLMACLFSIWKTQWMWRTVLNQPRMLTAVELIGVSTPIAAAIILSRPRRRRDGRDRGGLEAAKWIVVAASSLSACFLWTLITMPVTRSGLIFDFDIEVRHDLLGESLWHWANAFETALTLVPILVIAAWAGRFTWARLAYVPIASLAILPSLSLFAGDDQVRVACALTATQALTALPTAIVSWRLHRAGFAFRFG